MNLPVLYIVPLMFVFISCWNNWVLFRVTAFYIQIYSIQEEGEKKKNYSQLNQSCRWAFPYSFVWKFVETRNNSIGSLSSSSGNKNTHINTQFHFSFRSHQYISQNTFFLTKQKALWFVTREIEGFVKLRVFCLWNYQIFNIEELIKRHPVEEYNTSKSSRTCEKHQSPGKRKSINTIQGKYTQDEQPRLLERRIGQIYIALIPLHKKNTALGTFSGIIPIEKKMFCFHNNNVCDGFNWGSITDT